MLKTILGLIVVMLVFGGIFYYAVQKGTNKHYEFRVDQSYSGVVKDKYLVKKGTQNELPRLVMEQNPSLDIDWNLYNTVHIADSIIKTSGADSVIILRNSKTIIFKMLKPVFLKKKNYTVREIN